MRAADGSAYRKSFDFYVNGRRVHGWVGIPGQGASGRPCAGFSILRRGRVVRGIQNSYSRSSDSDFDWGQHAVALKRYFATYHVPKLYVSLNGTTRTCSLRLPQLKALPTHPVSGWVAVSERTYRLNRGAIQKDPCVPAGVPEQGILAPPGWLDWLKRYEPVDVIGKTVRLYHIPGPS